MRELKASTKAGQNIIERAKENIGTHLTDVYGTYSRAKEQAYNWCREEYVNTENSNYFHICSANIFCFTVAWYGTMNSENILRFETRDNSYLVWLDR